LSWRWSDTRKRKKTSTAEINRFFLQPGPVSYVMIEQEVASKHGKCS
jgi:hypothetical protein